MLRDSLQLIIANGLAVHVQYGEHYLAGNPEVLSSHQLHLLPSDKFSAMLLQVLTCGKEEGLSGRRDPAAVVQASRQDPDQSKKSTWRAAFSLRLWQQQMVQRSAAMMSTRNKVPEMARRAIKMGRSLPCNHAPMPDWFASASAWTVLLENVAPGPQQRWQLNYCMSM